MRGRGRGAGRGWSTGTLQHTAGWREAVGCVVGGVEELVMGVGGQKGVQGNGGGWALVHGARVADCGEMFGEEVGVYGEVAG